MDAAGVTWLAILHAKAPARTGWCQRQGPSVGDRDSRGRPQGFANEHWWSKPPEQSRLRAGTRSGFRIHALPLPSIREVASNSIRATLDDVLAGGVGGTT